jgi:hypothetical protein
MKPTDQQTICGLMPDPAELARVQFQRVGAVDVDPIGVCEGPGRGVVVLKVRAPCIDRCDVRLCGGIDR